MKAGARIAQVRFGLAAGDATGARPAALTGTSSEEDASGKAEEHRETEKLAKEIEAKRSGK